MKTLFISLDTLGATRLSCLGATKVDTPNLDALAASSAVFSNAFATDIPTQPSHTAVFTGRSGASTGIVSHFHPPARLADEIAWLPSLMQASGCRTGAVDHLFVMKEWFIRGYDDYLVPAGRSRSPAEVVNDLAFEWLDEHHRDDMFLFMHFWDAHIPYLPPEPFKSRYAGPFEGRRDPDLLEKLMSRPSYPLFKRNHYDLLDDLISLEHIEALHYAEIAYLDDQLGRLFNRLDDLGVLDDTLVVVFGDHGEVMTEHPAWFDHAGLYDAVTHVPLIIRAPGRVPATRVDSMVGLIDVMPTVLEVQGLTAPDGARFEGRSLMPVITGAETTHREVIHLSESTWQAKRGVRTAEWKFIRSYDNGIYDAPEIELYHLPSDPDEQRNVAASHPEVVAELDARMAGWLEGQLQGRPDPMLEVIEQGLPAVARLQGVINEDLAAEAEVALRDAPSELVVDLTRQERRSEAVTAGEPAA